MPKKAKLSELILELENDHLQEIILMIARNNPTLEDQIRIAITPKSDINNSITYYKKLITKGIPSRISNATSAKLTLECLKPVLKLANDYELSKNYREASKAYMAIIETLMVKIELTENLVIHKYLKEMITNWGQNLNKIVDNNTRKDTLNYFLEAKNGKTYKSKILMQYVYKMTSEGIKPMMIGSNISDFFYYFMVIIATYCTKEDTLDQLQEFVKIQPEDKENYLEVQLYLHKNKFEDKEFVKLISKNNNERSVIKIVKEWHLENERFKEALEIQYTYLVNIKDGFTQRSSIDYSIAIEYLNESQKYLNYSNNSHIQDILVLIITTGDCYTTYDVSPKAQWWIYYNQLKEIYRANWSKNYQIIIEILEKKNLTKQLLVICKEENDTKTALKLTNSKDSEIRFLAGRIITTIDPIKALEIFTKYYRYTDPYYYKKNQTETKEDFDKLREYLPMNKLVECDKLWKKIIAEY